MAKKSKPDDRQKKSKMELKRAAINACRDADGRIRPEAVWQAARNPNHILHDEFEWDVTKAAEAYWTARARQLIREFKFTIVHGEIRRVVPYYISDPTTDDSAYVETTKIAKRATVARQSLTDELARIKAAIHRAHSLAIVFNMEELFDKMLDTAVEVERHLELAEAAE